MALQKFNAENMYSSRSGSATIRFSKSAGLVTISQAAAEAIGLKAEDKIALLQDDESPADWFISIDPEGGFQLRKEKDSGALCFNNTAMAKSILEALGHDDATSVAFKVASEATEVDGGGVWPIITSAAKVTYPKTKE